MDKPGTCPKCGGNNLFYETCVNDADWIYYPYTCDDCNAVGKEWYDVTFTGYTMEQKTTLIFLRTVIEFADNNGYRIAGKSLAGLKLDFDREGIEHILEARPLFKVRCKLIGCGVDFRNTTSTDGWYKFYLIS